VVPEAVLAQEVSSAVDLAGRQRMLSQRIARAYAQWGVNVQTEQSRQILALSLEQFRQGQDQLRTLAILPDQRKLVAIMDGQWADVVKVCELPVDKVRAAELHSRVNATERLASQLTYLFSSAHTSKFGKLATTATRLKMLSQRHGKAYMLRAWGVDIPNLQIEMAIAADEFSSALNTLQTGSESVPVVQTDLAEVVFRWKELQAQTDILHTDASLARVADANEALLSAIEKLDRTIYALRGTAQVK
jgi:hypothetical protein